MKPKILILTTKYGHRSIAESIAQTLRAKKFDPVIHQSNHQSLQLYQPFYLFFPSLFKIPYKLTDQQAARKLFAKLAHRYYSKEINLVLEKHRPDIVISTWYYCNPILEQLKQKYHFTFLNVITDPRTFHYWIPSPQALNIVFDDAARRKCISMGLKSNQVKVAGWFVRHQYQTRYQKKSVRKKLGLLDQTTILITTGSEGTNAALKILPSLVQAKTTASIIFSCGHNQRLFDMIQKGMKVHTYLNTKLKIIPIRYTKDLETYMQAADLVVGKAGPNVLFESVATHTPFMAITHITGQEDGNLELIREYNLGLVEENPLNVNQKLLDIIYHPQQLNRYLPSIKKVATTNKHAGKILVSLLK